MGLTASALQIVGGATVLTGAVVQARAIKAQGDIAARSLRSQEELAEIRAEDALRRGVAEEAQQVASTKKLIGAQRAALAAQGIAVDVGSAFDIQSETAALGAQNAATIRINAARAALGFKLQAGAFAQQAAFGRLSARRRAAATLLTGGIAFTRSLARATQLQAPGPLRGADPFATQAPFGIQT